MKYGLHDFQKDAVKSLLLKMDSMRRAYDSDGSLSAVALTAPTGAGKTVISAAVIEGLFYGNDDYAGNDRAAILWLTDSPSLNEQTMKRFDAATDLLNNTVMESVGADFAKNHTKMLPGHVYFLNRQLLGKGKKLAGEAEGGRSFYDVLNNTIDDPDTHLFLFIDEAHRGLGSSGKDKGTSDKENKTIYSIIIDGQEGINKPVPCVVGVSATPERFDLAMKNRVNRDIKSAVKVPVEDVRASGLIKDTIELRTPKQSANTKHQDLTQACVKLANSSRLWKEYCDKNGDSVIPLMVLQVEDNVSKETLGTLCQQIHKTLPWLDISECFANVFGEHEDITTDFGAIPYISPENVTEHTEIKVLFAKDAVSTGWDCPRAEVIYSRRKRSDATYIAQLIGRMIRTPLARRIESSEELNTVACYLPEYDARTVENVVERLKSDNVAADGGATIMVNAAEVKFFAETKNKVEKQIKKIERPHQTVHEVDKSNSYNAKNHDFGVVVEDESEISFEPEQSQEELKAVIERVPKANGDVIKKSFEEIITRQVRHDKTNVFLDLWDCIDVISADIDVDADLDEQIMDEFYKNVEAEITRHPAEFKRSLKNIRNTTMSVKRIDPLTGEMFEDREELATNDVDRLTAYYKNTVNTFAEASDKIKYYINRRISDEDEDNATAVSRIAAVGYCMEIVQALETWAEKKIDSLLNEYSTQRYAVSDEHRSVWDRIEGNTKPFIERTLNISTTQTRQNMEFERYEKHIICDDNGWAYLKLNDIEQKVVKTELARSNNVAWYRNQSKNLNGSLSIPYEINGEYENMYPDFIFFQKISGGRIVRTIVDPHGDWLGDSVAKLKGYVAYLTDHPDMFGAVQVVADEKDGSLRYLDLMDGSTQTAIENFNGISAKELFNGPLSKPYKVKES